MAHKPETIAAVRHAYVYDRQDLTQAAKMYKVPVVTARNWKRKAKANGDDWDTARAASAMTTTNMEEILSSIVNDFVVLQQRLVTEITTEEDMPAKDKANMLNSLADSFSKFMAAAGRASPKMDKLALAMDLVQFLGRFITDHFPEYQEAFAEVLEPFGAEVSKRYG